ncbi:MAG: hypothetical protein ACKOU7_12685 [Ferruginibacter sp.]
MKAFIQIMVVLCCPMMAFCQDITGLWKGTMYNDSTKQSLDYEIVVTKVKGKLTGFSRTSYNLNNQNYFSIKKIDVRIARDGKIVFQDAKMVVNNYPDQQNKNIIQLNVLNLAKSGEESIMDGIFVTNRSKAYQSFTGRMSIKKVNPLLAQSDLWKYLQNSPGETDMTAVK